MEIIDIIKQSIHLLSLNEYYEVLDKASKENEEEVLKNEEIKKIFNLTNLVLHDLCTNYVPIVNKQIVNITNKTYPIKNLLNFYKIKNVKKDNLVEDYKMISKNIVVENDGEYEINYYYLPNVNSLFDELDFLSTLSPEVLVYGLCAFYCLSVGLFDEFKIYNDKYKSRAEAIKNLKVFELPKRKWEWLIQLK